MSIDWSAYAVIGCEVTGKLIQKIRSPGCKHNKPSGSPFCAQCGLPSSVIEEIPIAGYDRDAAKIGTFSVVGTSDDRRQFVGFMVGAGDFDQARMRPLPDFTEIKTALCAVLEPLGLWTEESFGLWSILCCLC
jgi:hypothetical protein